MTLALDHMELTLALLGLVGAGVIKGITGIGYATCAMPFLALAVGVDKALALVVVPGLISNAAVLASGRSIAPMLHRFAPLYLAILPGIVAGTLLLDMVDKQIAGQGLALMTLSYVALAVTKPALSMGRQLERPLALPTGFLNGVLTGLTGSQILPLVPYMLALRLDAEEQAHAINLAVTIASFVLGVALLATGIMTPELLMLSCAFSAPAIVATWIGSFCRGWLKIDAVRQLTLAVLVTSSAALISRPLLDAGLLAACGSEIAERPLADAPFSRTTAGRCPLHLSRRSRCRTSARSVRGQAAPVSVESERCLPQAQPSRRREKIMCCDERVRFIFTYGTLMSTAEGEKGARERALLRGFASLSGRARLRGRMYHAGAWPAAVLGGSANEHVHGEIWHVPQYVPELIQALDLYEGCAQASPIPHTYARRRIRVRTPDGRRVTAWMYQWALSVEDLTPIPDGRWRGPLRKPDPLLSYTAVAA